MRNLAWAATLALTTTALLTACSDDNEGEVSSTGGAGGTGNPGNEFFAAEDDPSESMGGRVPLGMGGTPPIDPGALCDRFSKNGNEQWAYKTAVDSIGATFPGYYHRDCRIRGYTEDPEFLSVSPNHVVELTMYLWGCEGYEFEDYAPRKDFPLSLPHWSPSSDDIAAFTDAYLAKVENSGLEFTRFEIEYFREKINELAEGATAPGSQGFTESRCVDGMGGSGGFGGENSLP